MKLLRRSVSSIASDTIWALRWIVPYVLVFGGMTVVAQVLGAKFPGLDLPITIRFYLGFGMLTAIVLGILRPVASSIVGAGAIGAVVGVPIGIFMRVLAFGWGRWVASDVLIITVFAGISSLCAIGFRRGYVRAETRAQSNTQGPGEAR